MCINVVCVCVCVVCLSRASPAYPSDSLLPSRALVTLRASPLTRFELVMTNWNRYSAFLKSVALASESRLRALFSSSIGLLFSLLHHAYTSYILTIIKPLLCVYVCACLSLFVYLLVVYWYACYVCACCVSMCMSYTIATSTTLCLSCLLLVYWLSYLLGV